jgi:hypothetical protein
VTANRRLEVGIQPVYSAAMHHAGMHLPVEVSIEPPIKRIHARLEIDSLHVGWSIGGTGAAPAISADSALRPALEAITGSRRATVRLTMARSVAEVEITMHEAWRWPLLPEAWPMIAAYVLPHDGIVLRLLADARAHGPHLPLDGLYGVLHGHRAIDWAPPALERTAEGITLQVLRPPWRIAGEGRGQASCLDLSLWVAGALEAAGESPLILFILDRSGFPEHAMVGNWRDGGQHFRPILRAAELKGWIEQGRIDLIDATYACTDPRRDFRNARERARELTAKAVDVVAVDITALRPPHGHISPYETMFDSAVVGAIAEAEIVAGEMGSTILETLHLFYGLWMSRGAVSEQLAAASRVSRDEILLWSRAAMKQRLKPGPRGRTRGFEGCLAAARENARSLGSTVVREEDLWWALLSGGSASLDRVFKERTGVRDALLSALAEISPPSRPESTRS